MSNPLACIIVDDEPLAIEVIEAYVRQLDSLDLKETFQNPVQAFEYIQRYPVELIFMDIQMPKLTGLDLIKSLPNCPSVILTTAYRDYALEGFELEVVDYLLKPVAFDRFLKAVRKVVDTRQVSSSLSEATTERTPQSIFVKVDKRKVKVCPEEVLYMESQRDYLRMVMPERELKTHMTMSEAEELFFSSDFIRVHRSFLINKNHIESFSAGEIEIGKSVIPIGRNYKSEVLRILDNLART
jgi:DNA-binding LytR/AlgR family response regulator